MKGAPDIHADRILILDFGAQYTQLIARRVRESGVYCEIHPWDMSDAEVRAFAPRGVILSGGPASVQTRSHRALRRRCLRSPCRCWASATECRPWQLSWADALRCPPCVSSVTPRLPSDGPGRLLDALQDRHDSSSNAMLDVWMSHGDHVDLLPQGFT